MGTKTDVLISKLTKAKDKIIEKSKSYEQSYESSSVLIKEEIIEALYQYFGYMLGILDFKISSFYQDILQKEMPLEDVENILIKRKIVKENYEEMFTNLTKITSLDQAIRNIPAYVEFNNIYASLINSEKTLLLSPLGFIQAYNEGIGFSRYLSLEDCDIVFSEYQKHFIELKEIMENSEIKTLKKVTD